MPDRRNPTAAEEPVEAGLLDEVRHALDGGQPLNLLGLVSMLIEATTAGGDELALPDEEKPPGLEELVHGFIDVQTRETTALLAALGQLLPADNLLCARCRAAAQNRTDALPRWLAELDATTVRKTVRMTHTFGDTDDLILGVRLADGLELTSVVSVDHHTQSAIIDAFFVPAPIEQVVAVAAANNTDPDTSFVGLEPADARIGLQRALNRQVPISLLADSDTWPGCRALVSWLAGLILDGA
jgi:hypothetical protein